MTEYEDVFCIVANCAHCGKPIYYDGDEWVEFGLDKVHEQCKENYKRNVLISRRCNITFNKQVEVTNGLSR